MTSPARPDVVVIVLIDALGWEITRKFGFCRNLLPRSGPLETVLGYSSAAIPSLLSGETPSRHGVWAMYAYAPHRSPFKPLRLLPRLPHALEWRLRALTKWMTQKRKVIKGYYDLYEVPLRLLGHFDIPQRGDPYAPGGLGVETIFDRMKAEDIRYRCWTYRTRERDNFEELRGRLGSGDRVLFLYTADLDALMHRVGIFHEEVGEKLAAYEREVGLILEAASRAGRDARLYLFSDHGMTDVKRVVDLMKEVEGWGYRLGRDIVAFYDSTMARFWCKPALRPSLVERLNGTGWGRVITDAELEAFGCRFEDRSYGDVVFLVSPGGLIVPSFMGREAIHAMHGYDPGDPFSKGCFMTNDGQGSLPASILDLKGYLLSRIRGKA